MKTTCFRISTAASLNWAYVRNTVEGITIEQEASRMCFGAVFRHQAA